MKKLLVKRGRNSKWGSFLKNQGIARPTGDRLAKAHLKSVDPQAHLLSTF